MLSLSYTWYIIILNTLQLSFIFLCNGYSPDVEKMTRTKSPVRKHFSKLIIKDTDKINV